MITFMLKKVRKLFSVFSLYIAPEKAFALPIAMQVEVSCGCNLSCRMCVLPKITRQRGKMSFEIFKHIYDQIKPDTVVLTGYGETLLNKDIIKMITYAKKNKSFVHMDTNCTLLDENIASRLITSGIDLVKVSVDAATKKTYDKIRIGSDHNAVWSNLKTLLRR